jgi:GTPase SAR1 family protein
VLCLTVVQVLPPPEQAVDFNTDISTHYSHHSLQEETGLPPLHRHNRLFLRIRRHLSRRTPDEPYIDPRYAQLQISEHRVVGPESAVPAHAVANETVAGPSATHTHSNETVAGPSAVHAEENITAAVHADDNAAEEDNDNDNASNASIIVTRPRNPGILNLLRTASTRIPSRLSLRGPSRLDRGPSRLNRAASRLSARVPSRLNRAASRISNLRVASRMSNLDPTPKTIRIAVIGDSFVGKTCLLNRLLSGTYTPTDGPSQEYRAADHTITLDGNPIIIEAWDIPGSIPEGTDNPLMSAFFHAAFICFDLENSHKTNIMDTIPARLTELRSCLVEAPVFVLGLKKDARPSFPMLRLPFLNEPYTISKDVGEKEARRIRAVGYFECSAKNGEGVKEVFEAAARYVVSKRDEDERMRSKGGKLRKSLGKKSHRLSQFFSGGVDPDLEE